MLVQSLGGQLGKDVGCALERGTPATLVFDLGQDARRDCILLRFGEGLSRPERFL
jgi:hypothetical protein